MIRSAEIVRDTFAANLKRYREKLGWTQLEMARKARISQSTIAQLELSKKTPSLEMAALIARTLKKTTVDMFSGER